MIHYLSDLKPRLSLFGALLGIFTYYLLSFVKAERYTLPDCAPGSGKPELRWSPVKSSWVMHFWAKLYFRIFIKVTLLKIYNSVFYAQVGGIEYRIV